MRVAILGGGASGLSAAWSLDAAHEVTLFERASVLGGHVRTLGGNVSAPGLPPGVRLDAGVVEFDRVNFPAFHAWMGALGIATEEPADAGATCLYRADGSCLHSTGASQAEQRRLRERLGELLHVVPAMLRLRRFLREVQPLDEETLARRSVGSFLGEGDFATWVRSLLMYAYSMSFDEVENISAALAVPMLREFLRPNRWTRIPGGVSRYVARVAETLRGTIHLGARIRTITRSAADASGAVAVAHEDGRLERFDAVVIAVPPHRVFALLADPSELERAFFENFRGARATTVVHTDTALYDRRRAHFFTEFDLFELADGTHGYNAYLNRLAGLPTSESPHYSLAFQLDGEIDPVTIIDRVHHDVAQYTAAALARRADLVRANGERATYYAGAFLGDGLHEGAVRSGLAVGAMLGGRIV